MNTAVPEIQRMFFVLYLIVVVCGLFGNVIIFNVFRKARRQSVFHIQLAVVNCVMVSSIILSGPSALYGEWLWGESLCTWFGLQVFFAGFATASFTCLICFESYLAVCHTRFYLKHSQKLMTYLSVAVWLYSLIFSLVPLLGWGRYKKERYSSSCGIDLTSYRGYNYSYITVIHAVFILMALLAVYSIIMMYRQKLDKTLQPYLQLFNNVELRRLAVVLFVNLGVSSLPFYIRTIYYLGGYPPLFKSFLTVEFSHWLIKLGSVLPCVAYLVCSVNFKRLVIQTTMAITGLHTNK